MNNTPFIHTPDPMLDLLLERVVDVPVELVWKAWTTPELITQWFTPKPWTTPEVELDLRPGGIFRTVMRGPEGEEFSGESCILEVVENSKLVWSSAMGAGFRPHPISKYGEDGMFSFTAVISMEAVGDQTKYSALVIHGDPEDKNRHDAMGFHSGWGTALTQLVELMQSQRAGTA